MKELNGMDEIVGYFKDLQTTATNGKIQLARIYGMAKRYDEQLQKEKAIENVLNLSNGERAAEVTFVGECIAIVQVERHWKGKEETYYHPVVNGKRCFEIADTFDRALAIALGEKYGVKSFAPQAICNILDMEKFEKANKPKSFIDMVISGEATADQIEHMVDTWHNDSSIGLELHEYLGMTEAEYGLWMHNDSVFETIVASVKSRM